MGLAITTNGGDGSALGLGRLALLRWAEARLLLLTPSDNGPKALKAAIPPTTDQSK
jgi:hypothetical protein